MTFGIIGLGQFGRFMAGHLAHFGEVRGYDTVGGTHTLEETAASDVVIFAVPVQSLKDAANAARPHIRPQSWIVDVSSIKVKPLSILKEVFPENEILGTHPIFGPQSGKNGIAGLTIAVSNVSLSEPHYQEALSFLKDSLKLSVVEMTPDEHDRQMARVQGLAHFIGRALKKLEITDYPTATQSYRHLLELRDLLKDDSWELFETIQKENPHAASVRAEFLAELERLEKLLS